MFMYTILYSDLFENSINIDYKRQNRSIFVHQGITGIKDHNQYIWIIIYIIYIIYKYVIII